MAMNASALKAEIASAVNAINVNNGAITNDQVLQAIATAIVNHIQSNAQAIVIGGSSSGAHSIV